MAGSAGDRDRPAAGGVSRLYRGADEGRSAGRRRSPATLGYGDDRASRGRQDQCAERTLCRKPRTARRLLPDRGTRSRCGAVLGGALPGREPRRDRGTTDLGNVSWDAAHLMLREGHRDARDAAERTARQSYGKLVAFLAHRLRDVAAAEDALAEAFAAALADWPRNGVPDRPEAWLLTVARRKAVDSDRRRRHREEATSDLQLLTEERTEMRDRLAPVLEAIYTVFSEGWSDPAGTETRRRNLADEAIWLGRLVGSLLPQEPEALGLLALMLFAEARRGARRNAAGDYIPLAEQD